MSRLLNGRSDLFKYNPSDIVAQMTHTATFSLLSFGSVLSSVIDGLLRLFSPHLSDVFIPMMDTSDAYGFAAQDT